VVEYRCVSIAREPRKLADATYIDMFCNVANNIQMTPMHLAIVTHNIMVGDGQSRVAYELARYAIEHGHRVSLFADFVAGDLQQRGVSWHRIHPDISRPHLLKVRSFVSKADRELNKLRDQFDVVQAFGFTLSVPHHVNNCQFVHHSWRNSTAHTSRVNPGFYGAYQWLYSFANMRWERKAFNNAERVVASSSLIRDQLIESGVSASRIKVIFNGVDTQEFSPGDSDRNGLGLPENVPLGLFVGDLRTPRKNLDTVLRAMVDLPGCHLAVVGDTERSPYPAMARELMLESRTHFLGFRKEIPRIMRSTDFFVFPSRYEACSLVLLEAAACGLPIITARTAGGSEAITPEAGVVLSDPNDVAALVSAIEPLVGNSARCRQMGDAARRIAECHTWQICAKSHFELYGEVAGPAVSSTDSLQSLGFR
jgi:glycosyltransferase involved in cell wall biosynthesis